MLRYRHQENSPRPILGGAISHTKSPFFTFWNISKNRKNADFVWEITPYRMGLGQFSWCLLHGIFRRLRRGILCFFCRRCFHGEIWETISPVFRVFQTKLKMVPKKGYNLSFLRHPLWPNDIVVAVDGQAERNGATFAFWDNFGNSQEHRQFSNLVTLKTAKVSSSAIWLICSYASQKVFEMSPELSAGCICLCLSLPWRSY